MKSIFLLLAFLIPGGDNAPNVYVGSKTVSACYQDCNVQFMINFRGELIAECDGISRCYPAETFQIEPGVWVADSGDIYARIDQKDGTTQTNIPGFDSLYLPE